MKLRIEMDGTAQGSKVYDLETENEIKGFTSCEIKHQAGDLPTIILTGRCERATITGNADISLACPYCGAKK